MKHMSYNKIRKALVILLTMLFCFNAFAVETNNDGSAFITKAEFDSLKNNFQSQIDTYNSNIDSKIDGAIAAYISGLNVAFEKDLTVGSYAEKVYCMKYHTNTEDKDMKYVYVKPYVNYEHVGWLSIPKRDSWYGVYMWDYIFTPKAKTSTGKRLLIKNTVDPSGAFKGTAEWVGYAEGVSETQSWVADDVITNGAWGAHTNSNRVALGMNHADPIKNTKLGSKNWKIGLAYMENGDGTASAYLKVLLDKWNIYLMNMSMSYSTLKNSNMIIWAPETYYCFTEQDVQRDYMFDAKQVISGWTESNTSAEKVYMTLTKAPSETQTGLNDFSDLFSGCSTANSTWWQSNINSGGQEKVGNIIIDTRIAYKLYDYGTNVPSGGSAKNRQPYTTQGFPYYSISDWKQLYISLNDWAAEDSTISSNDSVITTPAGDKHLSLNGGWPVINTINGATYEYKVSFDEASDHLIWGKLEPFNTNNANTESGTIEWDDSVEKATGFKNAALVGSGRTVTLKFTAKKDGCFYLKWSDKPSSGTSCKGGGTLKPSKTIHERLAD